MININKNKYIIWIVLIVWIFSFYGIDNNTHLAKANLLENKEMKNEYEKILIEKDKKIKVIENKREKEIKTIVEEKKEILLEYTKKDNILLKPLIEKVFKLKEDTKQLRINLEKIKLNNCWLLKNIDSKHFDKNSACKRKIIKKEIIKKSTLGYTEDWKKIKFQLTRYFTPEHSQLYFKNTWKNWKVVFGWKLYPQNEQERWKYFTADWRMQCWTTWIKFSKNKNKKRKDIKIIENSCLSPWITPFVTVNNDKENFILNQNDAMKVIACDYEYISKIANLWCNPKIFNNTPKSEWKERIDCRKRLNKEIVIDIKGLWKVKCLDSGWMINKAHFDIWVWIWDKALNNLEKQQIWNITKTDYYYDINGKKLDNPKNGLYAEIDIYKNWKKIY